MSYTHNLKIWPVFFEAIVSGRKTFEIRRDDRAPQFAVGDTLLLREWWPGSKTYTGAWARCEVRSLVAATDLSIRGVAPGYVVMGILLQSHGAAVGDEGQRMPDADCQEASGFSVGAAPPPPPLPTIPDISRAIREEMQEWEKDRVQAQAEIEELATAHRVLDRIERKMRHEGKA